MTEASPPNPPFPPPMIPHTRCMTRCKHYICVLIPMAVVGKQIHVINWFIKLTLYELIVCITLPWIWQ